MPEVGVSEEGDCCKIIFLFNDPKLKNEIFVRIDMKHANFSNYLVQSIFSGVETVVVCQTYFVFMHDFCSCCIKKFKVTNLTL